MVASIPISQGTARFRLRDATASDHAAVDRAYSSFDLSSRAGYRAFLEAQYGCLAPLENALTTAGVERLAPDWRIRRRAALLAADLGDLGANPQSIPHLALDVRFAEPAAQLGALYVVEGSRFGGAVLARRLPPGTPCGFLGAASDPHAWRALVATMDRHLQTGPAMAAAVASARAVFAAFEAAAHLRVEVALG